MVDNLTIPASGTGTATPVVATDDVAGVHFQKVKLIEATAESTTATGVSANPLRVDPTGTTAQPVTDNGSTLSVDDGAGSLTVDGSVSIGSALPAGTNNIGDVDVLSIAAGDNNIGNVDIVTMPNVTIGTNTNLTESLVDDAAFTPATSRVVPVGFEFDDTLPDSVNEGDIGAARMSANRNIYTTLRDAAGNERGANINASNQLEVNVGSALPAGDNNIGNVDLASALPAGTNNIGDVDVLTLPNVTNAGTFAVQESGAALTALQLIDDAVYTDGTGTPSKAIGIAGTDGTNPQIVKTDTAGELQVDVLTLPSVTVGAALPAGTNNIGDVDILSIAAGDNNIGNVDIASALPAGTNNIGDVDVLTLPGVAGDVAHDTADSGNPVKIGHKAIAHGANPTAVAANDRSDWYANRHGIPFMLGGHPNIVTLEAAYTAAQTDTALVASIAAGTKVVVTQVQALCDNANTVDVGVRVGFGATTTPTTTGVVLTHPGIAPGSGISRGDGSGILGIGADGEEVRVTCEVPTTGSIRVLISYFTIES